MHQHRLVWTVRQVHDSNMHDGLFAGLHIRKIKAVLINTYLPDKIRMGFSKILYFLHHLSIELQIDQMRLRIAVNGYGFIEMPQSLRIKSDIDHSLCPRSDRSLCPPGYGAGAIGLHVGKYQRLVTCVRNGVLHRYRMFPFNLSEIVRLRIGSKTRLCYGSQCRSSKRI